MFRQCRKHGTEFGLRRLQFHKLTQSTPQRKQCSTSASALCHVQCVWICLSLSLTPPNRISRSLSTGDTRPPFLQLPITLAPSCSQHWWFPSAVLHPGDTGFIVRSETRRVKLPGQRRAAFYSVQDTDGVWLAGRFYALNSFASVSFSLVWKFSLRGKLSLSLASHLSRPSVLSHSYLRLLFAFCSHVFSSRLHMSQLSLSPDPLQLNCIQRPLLEFLSLFLHKYPIVYILVAINNVFVQMSNDFLWLLFPIEISNW